MPEPHSELGTRKPELDLAPLPRSVFAPTAEVVAPRLLGHLLIRNTPSGPCGGYIVETEAYLQNDPACHAFRGQTARNGAMYGPPGHAYVYFIYGNHYCVNAVCQPAGCGEAVLIRAIEVTYGEDLMRAHRPVDAVHQLTNGPGKLCAALHIDRRLDGVDLTDPRSPLFIACNAARARFLRQHGPIASAPRVGITAAAHLPLRFFLAGNPFVSRRSSGAATTAANRGRRQFIKSTR